MSAPRGPELDAEMRDEPSSTTLVVSPLVVAVEHFLAAWRADGATHALRCSSGVVAGVDLMAAALELERGR